MNYRPASHEREASGKAPAPSAPIASAFGWTSVPWPTCAAYPKGFSAQTPPTGSLQLRYLRIWSKNTCGNWRKSSATWVVWWRSHWYAATRPSPTLLRIPPGRSPKRCVVSEFYRTPAPQPGQVPGIVPYLRRADINLSPVLSLATHAQSNTRAKPTPEHAMPDRKLRSNLASPVRDMSNDLQPAAA